MDKTPHKNNSTKGGIESEIAAALVKFQREQQGRGPTDVRVTLVNDLVIVRRSGIFTAIEGRLDATEEGRRLIQNTRKELYTINRREMEAIVAEIVGCPVLRSYEDTDPEAAEMLDVFLLKEDVEKRFSREEADPLGNLYTRRGG